MLWLKVLRKKNASVIFATQSLEDITKCKILDAILQSCPTKIFLPDPNATKENMRPIYQMFDMNDQEIQILSTATQQKDYYYKSPMGSRVFELALGKEELAYVAASGVKDREMAKSLLSEFGKEGFNEKWREYKMLDDEKMAR